MAKSILPYMELSSATVIAGSSVVAGKLMVNKLPLFLTQGICLMAALMVLIPLTLKKEKGIPRINTKDLPVIFLQALTGMFLFRVFMLYGLKHTSAIESGIITSSTPAVLALFSFVAFKEKFTWNRTAGILFTVAGILMINTIGVGETQGQGLNTLAGNLLILFAVICEALLTVFRKMTSKAVSPITGTTMVTIFSFILFIPFSIMDVQRIDFAAISLNQWLLILYYGIVVTAMAYILWFSGVSKVSAGTAAVYTGCIPVSTVLLSCAVLKESFTWIHLGGTFLVISGIVFMTIFKSKEI